MIETSIILPVYNAHNYLNICLDSIVAQDYKDYELIAINDGSKDDSLDILKSYADTIDNLVIIDKENAGPNKARVDGLKIAKGKYISFIDCDDLYEKDYLSSLVTVMKENDLDLVECGYYEFHNIDKAENINVHDSVFIEDANEFNNKIIRNIIVDGREAVVLWNKLYKKELIDEFVKDYHSPLLEDYMFNMQYYFGIKRYMYIDKALYGYRLNESSISRTYRPEIVDCLVYVQKFKDSVFEKREDYTNIQELLEDWFQNYLTLILKSIFLYEKDNSIRKREIEKICNNDYIHSYLSKCNKNRITNCIYNCKINQIVVLGLIYRTTFLAKEKLGK